MEGPRASVGAEARFGVVDGFVQSSRGGRVTGTSSRRPTFGELDFDSACAQEIFASAGWLYHEAWIRARLTSLSGSTGLDKSLTTVGTTFPAGTDLRSELQMDLYRFGYAQRFLLGPDEAPLAIVPSVGATFFDFDYRVRGGGASAERAFLWIQPCLGIGVEGGLWGPLAFSADVSIVPPVIDGRFSVTAEARLRYPLWDGVYATLGASYEHVDFRDGQGVPNRVQADFGPTGIFGVEFRF